MSSGLVLFILLAYFGILILISYFTSRKSDNETFFTAIPDFTRYGDKRYS